LLCQAPPLPGDHAAGGRVLEGGEGGGGGRVLEGGEGGGGGRVLKGGDDDLRARTLATQALKSGHWECGECLKDAQAQTNNMKCRSKRKTLSFQFKPTVNYTHVDQSTIEIFHYDDSFECETHEIKKP
jgi:hypothetical protein